MWWPLHNVTLIRLTCHSDLSSPRQVEVWEASLVQGVDLRAMGVGLHPTTLLERERGGVSESGTPEWHSKPFYFQYLIQHLQ